MKNRDNRPEKTDSSANPEQTLRRQAEELARDKASLPPEDLDALSSEEIRPMFHELRVHQIELEIQNEELRRTQAVLKARV